MLIYFRESVLAILKGCLPPSFKELVKTLSENHLLTEDDALEEQVYADFDDDCGVIFFPPVYVQRYAAVCDCLMDGQWCGKLKKVLNIGKQYDINFLKYLSGMPGISQILGLDTESFLTCTYDMPCLFDEYEQYWKTPLQVTLLQGNAADPDYRLIGCDAVIAIDLLEKLLPHDLDRLVHNIFGFAKPWVVIFTTFNADFNHILKKLNDDVLRDSDHYFEWTRAQLHDWCSNIVERYPEYVVTSKGVGPGPPGTSHYGCYSQLVLFVSQQYKKEMELNVDSLVLVSSLPDPIKLSDVGWVSPPESPSLSNMLHDLEEVESSELHYPDSLGTSLEDLTRFSSEMICQYVDKSSQCNIDVEQAKSFVMFNYEDLYETLTPRQRIYRNVYEIGDVFDRLNNTMHEVKQFSKTTQFLIEKNELETIMNQEVLQEISQLTDKFALKVSHNDGNGHTWNNVNWGENVPYWNQYYKVIASYNYPMEVNFEDEIILDLLSEEIYKRLDMQGTDSPEQESKRFEIPLEHLMAVVKHITDDADRVIKLMEDNGYALEGHMLVLSTTKLSIGEDSESIYDLESLSNESSIGMDSNVFVLNRGRKVKKLQLLLQKDEEVSKALGQVVGRLKKIALSCGQSLQGPARTRWLQSKLLELLTMMEKTILRRKMRYDNNEQKKIDYETGRDTAIHLSKFKAEDDTTMKIVEKYRNIVQEKSRDRLNDLESHNDEASKLCACSPVSENRKMIKNELYQELVYEISKGLTLLPTAGMKRHTLDDQQIEKDMSCYQEETNETEISKSYNMKMFPTYSQYMKLRKEMNIKSDIKKKKTSSSNNILCKKKSIHKDRNSMSFVSFKNVLKKSSNYKTHNGKVISRAAPEKVLKRLTFDDTLDCFENIINKPTLVLSVTPNPIPDSILELCHPDLNQEYMLVQEINKSWDAKMESLVSVTEINHVVEIITHDEKMTVALQRTIGINPAVDFEVYESELELSGETSLTEATYVANRTRPKDTTEEGQKQSYKNILNDTPERTTSRIELDDRWHGAIRFAPPTHPVSFTEETRIVEILTQNECETVALQRSIGTEPDINESADRILKDSKLTNSLYDTTSREDLTSQEFFLFDINEPTTSKGLRHVSMDVQCGTDAKISNYAMLSATTSFTTPYKMFGTGLKIGDSVSDVKSVIKNDCVTSTHDILKPSEPTSSPWTKCVGIKIKDSCHQIDDSLPDSVETDCIGTTPCNSPNTTCGALTKKIKANLASSVSTKHNALACQRSKSHVINVVESNRPNRAPRSLSVVTRHLHIPNQMEPKLARGNVHVHSFKDMHVSEDVIYQGEWQRQRDKPLQKNLTYYLPRKCSEPYTGKSNFIRKVIVPMKPQKVHGKYQVTKVLTSPNRAKGEMTKNMPNKTVPTNPRVTKTKPAVLPKITPKPTASISKPKEKTLKTIIQPNTQEPRAQYNYAVNENKNKSRTAFNKNKVPKQHKVQKIPSKSRVKTDTQSNPSTVNNQRKTLTSAQSKVGDLIDALIKDSIKQPKQVNYVVYQNETDAERRCTKIEKIPDSTKPSDKENGIRRHVSSPSQGSSTCSSPNSVATVLNPQIGNRSLKFRRQPMSNKPIVKHKNSDSKIISKIKKLVTKIKKSAQDFSKVDNVPGTSIVLEPKHCASVHLVLVDTHVSSDVTASQISSKLSVTKSLVKSSDSKNGSAVIDKSEEKLSTDDTTTVLVIDPRKTQTSNDSQDLATITKKTTLETVNKNDTIEKSRTVTDYNSVSGAMRQFVEKTLEFVDVPKHNISDGAEIVESRSCDTNADSEMNVAGTYVAESLCSLSQSTTDFSNKSLPSAAKTSECFADNESWNNGSPPCNNATKVDYIYKEEVISINEIPTLAERFSTFSLHAEPHLAPAQSDYVNLVDSETGSYVTAVPRPATSEEMLVSSRTSKSYMSCVLDEDAVIPCWLFDENSQQASDSFSSSHPEISEHQELGVELPEPFALAYDENGNELAVHGAGAGDGHGIHSDHSQDSSGRGTSFSSSAGSSGAASETIVIEPAAFVEQSENTRGHASGAFAPLAPRPESIDTSFISAVENQNTTRSRIPRSTRRISLPASDADISSLDTDATSDNWTP